VISSLRRPPVPEQVLYSFLPAKQLQRWVIVRTLDLVRDRHRKSLYGDDLFRRQTPRMPAPSFQLTPNSSGGWTPKRCCTAFLPGRPMRRWREPQVAGLIMDSAGQSLRHGHQKRATGARVSLFQLTPTSSGWSYQVRYRFFARP